MHIYVAYDSVLMTCFTMGTTVTAVVTPSFCCLCLISHYHICSSTTPWFRTPRAWFIYIGPQTPWHTT